MPRVACCSAALGASSVMFHLVTRTTIAYCLHKTKSADGLSSLTQSVAGKEGLPICRLEVRREVHIRIFKCLVVLRNVSIIHPLHSARPFTSKPMRFLRTGLLQTEAGQLVLAALRTP